ncbi:hypothetical protein HYQ46_002955 [Verticillium longisporum]|nr:hypothetical protein HYQ46_002955 [Verticillium longisporum]
MAAAAVGTGAAAIGIKEYKKKKDAEKEREDEAARRARERSLSRDYSRDRSRRRDEDRRRYEEESNSNPHYDDYSRPPSPPHASGGAYYPTPTGSGFSQNQSVNDPRAGHRLLQELREASRRQPQADLRCRIQAGLPPSAVARPQQAADLALIIWFEGAVASATRKTVGVNFIVPGSDEVCGRNVYGCVHICYEIRHMGSLVA